VAVCAASDRRAGSGSVSMSSDVTQMVVSIPWWAWIAIVAIVCGSVSGIVKMRYQHLERIEMIRQGMNPDSGKSGSPPEV